VLVWKEVWGKSLTTSLSKGEGEFVRAFFVIMY
jgi:hypothetical protein